MSSSPTKPTPGRSRAPRGTLKPDMIVKAAIELIDEDGLESLTIGRLAKRLRVAPMSLYTHFRDKEAILLAVATELFSHFEMPEDDSSDLEMLRKIMRAYLHLLVDNPVLLKLYAAGREANPIEVGFDDAIFGCLERMGIDPRTGVELSSTLVRFVIGCALVYPRKEWEEDPRSWNRARRRLPPTETYPSIRELTRGEVPFSQDHLFEAGLETIFADIRTARRSARGDH
jgi:AcrR family transcriptional regulator